MSAFETYIRDLQEIRATRAAVKETSYYGALEKLLNELGKTLKPKVRCVMQSAIAEVIEQLGPASHDIYLNDIAYWKNIPDSRVVLHNWRV
jgi:hypothetical protein